MPRVSKQRGRSGRNLRAAEFAQNPSATETAGRPLNGWPQPLEANWSPVRSYAVLALTTVLCLLPFSGRAFHVDDTLFIRAAQNIAEHPLDPYGFQITWDAVPQPMSEVTQNPPLASYYAALVGNAFGWSERALHSGFLLISVLLVLGVYRLASRFTQTPLLAALATLLTPGVLVSACSVMCDTMMLTVWVWAAILWMEGLEHRKQGLLVGAAFLVGLAALTKYFAISLIPLLAAYSLLRLRRVGAWALYFLIPIAMLIWYQLWTEKLYGHGLLLGAAQFASTQRANVGVPWTTMVVVGLSFAGGCALIVLPFAPMLWPRLVLFGAALCGAIGTVAVEREWLGLGLQVAGSYDLRHDWLSVDVQLTLAIAAGLLVLWLAMTDYFVRRDSESAFLALWVLGTFVFATLINYAVNARSVLPLIPPVAILVVRRLETMYGGDLRGQWLKIAVALALSAAVALLVAGGDSALANSARRAAAMAVEKTRDRTGTLWFEGHWGFQYYMERTGAVPLNMEKPVMGSGDIVVIPHNNIYIGLVGRGRIASSQTYEVVPGGWASTIDGTHRAGFYSSYWGPLPYVIGRPAVERYTILRIGPA